VTLPFLELELAASLTFQPGTACNAGVGDHITLSYTLVIDGLTVNRSVPIVRSAIRNDVLTVEDADRFAYLLARVLARQVSLANVRPALLNTVVDLTAVIA
jgi:hypothetical protein